MSEEKLNVNQNTLSGERSTFANTSEEYSVFRTETYTPFFYRHSDNEQVALNKGALIYNPVDFTIPGRGGLDLTIRRRYDSTLSNDYEFVEFIKGNSMIRYARAERVLHEKYALGPGWSFDLPSLELVKFRPTTNSNNVIVRYIHLGDGRVFTIPDEFYNDGSSDLEDYAPRDYRLFDKKNDQTLRLSYPGTSNGDKVVKYRYVLRYKDGKKIYFTTLNAVAVQDRFGNSIAFDYNPDNNVVLQITTTTGEEVSLKKRNITNSENYELVWEGIPGTSPVYTVVDGSLKEYKDSASQKTIYDYVEQPARARGSGGSWTDPVTYFNLTKITHPTNASSHYEYEIVKHNYDWYDHVERNVLKNRWDQDDKHIRNKENYHFTIGSDNAVQEAVVTKSPGEPDEFATTHRFGWGLKDEEEAKYKSKTVLNKKYSYYGEVFLEKESLSEPYKAETIIEYDGNKPNNIEIYGDVTATIDPEKNRVEMTYDSTYHLLTTKAYKINNESEASSSYTYVKEKYTLTSKKDAIGEKKVYEVENSTTTSEANLKSLTKFEYDSFGNVTKEYRYYGDLSAEKQYYTTSYTYDNGITAFCRKIDQNGVSVEGEIKEITESATYDGYGRPLKKTEASPLTETELKTTTYAYDAVGRPLSETYADSSVKTWEYNVSAGVNQLVSTDERGYQVQYDYTLLGLPSKDSLLEGEKPYPLCERTYDEYCREISRTDYDAGGSNKRVTETAYDYLDRVTSRVVKNSDKKLLREETIEYDDANLTETKTLVGDDDAPSVVTIETRDRLGQVTKTVTGNSSVITVYDGAGNKLRQTDPNGNVTNWRYDHRGNVVKVINAATDESKSTYNPLGYKTVAEDFKGNETLYTCDSLGRVTLEQRPFEKNTTGAVIYAETKYTYDAVGNLLTQKVLCSKPGEAAAWRASAFKYDSRNRVETATLYETDGTANRTEYVYDKAGNKTEVYTGILGANARGTGAKTAYEYDRFSNVTKITDALLQAETFDYDRTGRLTTKTDRNGNVASYDYDDLDRLRTETVTEPGGKTSSTGHDYTLTGRKSLESNGTLTVSFVYDNQGRLTKQTEGSTVKSYDYNMCGNRTSFTLTRNGTTEISLTYEYDKLNRPYEVYKGGALIASYGYDANSKRIDLTYPNGCKTSYTYNLAGMAVSLINKNSDEAVVSSYNYNYYLDGNQAGKTDHKGRETTYSYDSMGRLASEAVKNGAALSYTYDRFGNRTKMIATGTESYTTTYSYDGNNRLTSEEKTEKGKVSTTAYRYDKNGNQLKKQTEVLESLSASPKKKVSFKDDLEILEMRRYNGINQLIWAYIDGVVAEYAYRPDNLRHSKTVDGVATTHLWDGQNISADVTGSSVTARYLRGAGLIAREQDGNLQYYRFNAHGDVVQRCDAWGNPLKSYEYDAFGVEENPEKLDTNPFRYCGEYYDRETKTVYLRARYYHPRLGRFGCEDPARDGLNWYTYCECNPVVFVDPTGCTITLSSTNGSTSNTLIKEDLQELTDHKLGRKNGKVVILRKEENEKNITKPMGNALIERLIENENYTVEIRTTKGGNGATPAGGSKTVIQYNLTSEPDIMVADRYINVTKGGVVQSIPVAVKEDPIRPSYIGLVHEMIHADHYSRGTAKGDKNNPSDVMSLRFAKTVNGKISTYIKNNVLKNEVRAVGLSTSVQQENDITENDIRKEHNLKPRAYY